MQTYKEVVSKFKEKNSKTPKTTWRYESWGDSYEQGGRVGFKRGSVKEFTMKKEKYITKNGKVAYKPLDVVANTPEAKKKLANFAKEYRRFKSFPPTSAAAKQAGVLGTRELYNKYFKNSFEYDTYNKSLLSILEKFRALQILGETILKNDYHNVNIINYFT